MAFASGDGYSTSAYWKRKGSSIPTSYTVYRHFDDNEFYAECNIPSGTNFGPSTDANAIIQNALTAIGDNGKLHLKAGLYPFDGLNILNSIAATDNIRQMIEIEGEGIGNTILQGNTTSAGATSADPLFTDKAWLMIDSKETNGIRVYLHDFQIDGQHDSQTNLVSGIVLRYGRDAMIERVWVRRCSKNGINAIGPNLSYRGTTIQDCQVFDINDPDGSPAAGRLDNCCGINLSGGVADVFVRRNLVGWIGYVNDAGPWLGAGIGVGDSCVVEGNIVWVASTGIETYQDAKDQIINNNLVDFTTDAGILLTQNIQVTCNNNTIRMPYDYGIYLDNTTKSSIQGNKFILRPTYSATSFITEAGTSDENSILNNNCEHNGTVTGVLIRPVGANTIAKNNQGFNPIGTIVNPFDTTDNLIIYEGGDAATPEASIAYVICQADILIWSTNSGNADCAINIYNPAGGILNPTPLSTINGLIVPVGHKITWGAYTGVAPTVTISFL